MNKTKQLEQKRTQSGGAVYVSSAQFAEMISAGYVTLDKCPEVVTACHEIANLIASMTIRLMSNGENGDIRIENELSRKVDIYPHPYMTRHVWMEAIVMNLLLYGKGNSVILPVTRDGMLDKLIPVDPSTVNFINQTNDSYLVSINGTIFPPSEVLHLAINPDPHYPWKGRGLTAYAKDIAENLKQANSTTKAFMSSKYLPSVVVKIDGLIDEFSSKEGRDKLTKEYLETSEAGKPWMVPAGVMEVEQIKPLSLADLAIDKTVELDKKTVASIVGVPPFVLGVGNYDADEWNHFINDRVHGIAQLIEQEFTKKLLVSPKWYFEFSMHSLHAYNLKDTASVFGDLYTKGLVTGNEVRSRLSLGYREGLDELMLLENYIPLAKSGDQAKLNGGNT